MEFESAAAVLAPHKAAAKRKRNELEMLLTVSGTLERAGSFSEATDLAPPCPSPDIQHETDEEIARRLHEQLNGIRAASRRTTRPEPALTSTAAKPQSLTSPRTSAAPLVSPKPQPVAPAAVTTAPAMRAVKGAGDAAPAGGAPPSKQPSAGPASGSPFRRKNTGGMLRELQMLCESNAPAAVLSGKGRDSTAPAPARAVRPQRPPAPAADAPPPLPLSPAKQRTSAGGVSSSGRVFALGSASGPGFDGSHAAKKPANCGSVPGAAKPPLLSIKAPSSAAVSLSPPGGVAAAAASAEPPHSHKQQHSSGHDGSGTPTCVLDARSLMATHTHSSSSGSECEPAATTALPGLQRVSGSDGRSRGVSSDGHHADADMQQQGGGASTAGSAVQLQAAAPHAAMPSTAVAPQAAAPRGGAGHLEPSGGVADGADVGAAIGDCEAGAGSALTPPGSATSPSPSTCTWKVAKLPMVRHSGVWYRARTLQEKATRVLLEFPGFAALTPPFWLGRDSDRIWRGSYKGRDWKYLGHGAWEPKTCAFKRGKQGTTKNGMPIPLRHPPASLSSAPSGMAAPGSSSFGGFASGRSEEGEDDDLGSDMEEEVEGGDGVDGGAFAAVGASSAQQQQRPCPPLALPRTSSAGAKPHQQLLQEPQPLAARAALPPRPQRARTLGQDFRTSKHATRLPGPSAIKQEARPDAAAAVVKAEGAPPAAAAAPLPLYMVRKRLVAAAVASEKLAAAAAPAAPLAAAGSAAAPAQQQELMGPPLEPSALAPRPAKRRALEASAAAAAAAAGPRRGGSSAQQAASGPALPCLASPGHDAAAAQDEAMHAVDEAGAAGEQAASARRKRKGVPMRSRTDGECPTQPGRKREAFCIPEFLRAQYEWGMAPPAPLARAQRSAGGSSGAHHHNAGCGGAWGAMSALGHDGSGGLAEPTAADNEGEAGRRPAVAAAWGCQWDGGSGSGQSEEEREEERGLDEADDEAAAAAYVMQSLSRGGSLACASGSLSRLPTAPGALQPPGHSSFAAASTAASSGGLLLSAAASLLEGANNGGGSPAIATAAAAAPRHQQRCAASAAVLHSTPRAARRTGRMPSAASGELRLPALSVSASLQLQVAAHSAAARPAPAATSASVSMAALAAAASAPLPVTTTFTGLPLMAPAARPSMAGAGAASALALQLQAARLITTSTSAGNAAGSSRAASTSSITGALAAAMAAAAAAAAPLPASQRHLHSPGGHSLQPLLDAVGDLAKDGHPTMQQLAVRAQKEVDGMGASLGGGTSGAAAVAALGGAAVPGTRRPSLPAAAAGQPLILPGVLSLLPSLEAVQRLRQASNPLSGGAQAAADAARVQLFV